MSNTNPFLNRQAFNPDIAARVEHAYNRNVDSGRVPSGVFTDDVSVVGLEGVVKKVTKEAKASNGAYATSFDQLVSLDTKRAFETSFEIAKQIFDRINLAIPTVEECALAGIDLGALGEAYEQMQADGLEPAIVLAPNLDLVSWHDIYKDLEEDIAVNRDDHIENGGLSVDNIVDGEWAKLVTPPNDVPVVSAHDGEHSWTLRLIPSTPQPAETVVDHDYNEAAHPTISEYLSLQAARLQTSQDPLDADRYTWLNNSTVRAGNHIIQAPVGYWESGESWSNRGWVSICQINASHRTGRLGVRPPVWK